MQGIPGPCVSCYASVAAWVKPNVDPAQTNHGMKGNRGGARQRYQNRSRSRSRDRLLTGGSASSNPTALPVQGDAGFRTQLSRMYLSGQISARITHSLSQSASAAGASGVQDLGPAAKRGALPGNAQRDIMRRRLNGCTVPEPYFAEIPIHDPDTGRGQVGIMLPLLLIHEMLAALCAPGEHMVQQFANASPAVNRLVEKFCQKTSLLTRNVIPLGIHGDGVPHQKTRAYKSYLGAAFPIRRQNVSYLAL